MEEDQLRSNPSPTLTPVSHESPQLLSSGNYLTNEKKKAHKKGKQWVPLSLNKLEDMDEDKARAKLAQIKLQGHLHKWSNVNRGWKRRYFSLNNGVFKYSQRQKEINDKDLIIPLIHSVILKEDILSSRFVIDTGTFVFNLRAKSHKERDEWINALLQTRELLLMLQTKVYPKLSVILPVPLSSSSSGSIVNLQDTINKIKQTKKQIKVVGSMEKSGSITPISIDKSPRTTKKKEHHTEMKKSKSKSKETDEQEQQLFKLRDELVQHAKTLIDQANTLLEQQQQLQQVLQDSTAQKKGSQTEKAEARRNISESEGTIITSTPQDLSSSAVPKDAKTTSEDHSSSEEYFDVEDAWEGGKNDDENSSSTDEDFRDRGSSGAGRGDQPSDAIQKRPALSRMSKSIFTNLQSLKVAPHKVPHQFTLQEVLQLVPEDFKPRTSLPHFRDPTLKLNVGKFIKDCIGKDLTKITMPVVFSEPLSLLQRLAEEYGAYTEVLDTAVKSDYSPLRVAYVAAFAISCYTSTPNRFYKPFNPILGETYELINKEKKYWLFSEQVSHHPPVSACICVGEGWTISGHAEVKTKFWGKSFTVHPVGAQTLTFHAQNDVFVWNKATTVINNVLMGTKWVDHYGEMDIINRTTGDKCTLNLNKTSGWFESGTTAKVTGTVYDNNNNPCYLIEGTWTNSLTAIPYTPSGELNENGKILLWESAPWPDNLKEQYNYTSFAIAENELPMFVIPYLPITDSRWRPDQRAFENGEIEFSQNEKTRLENVQRDMRRLREERGEEYKPKWFEQNKTNGTYVYKGGYWEKRIAKNWDGLEIENIFTLDLDNFRNQTSNK